MGSHSDLLLGSLNAEEKYLPVTTALASQRSKLTKREDGEEEEEVEEVEEDGGETLGEHLHLHSFRLQISFQFSSLQSSHLLSITSSFANGKPSAS